MNQKIVFAVIILIFSNYLNINSQIAICGTKSPHKDPFTIPYYGNSEFLQDVKQIVAQLKQYQKDASIDDLVNEGVLFDLPIKVWLYANDNGSSAALTDNQVLTIIDNINDRFDNTEADIHFYLKCEIEHINNSFYNQEMDSDDDILTDLFAAHRDEKAINIHIARNENIADEGYILLGMAQFPGEQYDLSLVVFSHPGSLTLDNIAESIVHEFGHVVDLRHTMQCDRCNDQRYNVYATDCFQESVSRSNTNGIGCIGTWLEYKCEINGDYLCSTEAAPLPIWDEVTNCTYYGSWEDNWNDAFIPQVDNYMLYTDLGCINTFTDEQISVMYASILINMHQYIGSGYYEFWYNGDILSASGLIEDEESEEILIAGDLTIPTEGETFGAEPGSETEIRAQNSIVLDYGFSVDLGAYLTASVGEIEHSKCKSVDFLVTNDVQKDYSEDLNLKDQKARLMLKTTLELESLINNTLRKQQEKKESIMELERIWRIDSSLVIAAYDPDKTVVEIAKSLREGFSGFSNEILVFPNPVESELSISVRKNDIGSRDLRIAIYDQVGIVRYSNEYNASDQIKINVSDLPSGVYWYSIETNNKTFSGKFVKN